MKTIGLIGGMSWESTLDYYKIINEKVNSKLGRLHSAKILLYSVDFEEVKALVNQGNWLDATTILVDAAKRLEKGGADLILICANTMHKQFNEVQANVRIPLLHIADATAEQIVAKRLSKVGLFGTKITMEEEFYKERLVKKYGLEVIVPSEKERQLIDDVIFGELCHGKINPSSRSEFKKIIENLANNGCEAIILGCTELSLLVKPEDSLVPLFDTTRIHAEAAVEYALKDK